MKTHHWIATPFLLLGGFWLVALASQLPFGSQQTWGRAAFGLGFTALLTFVCLVPAWLAWQRRWADFVPIVLGGACMIAFAAFSGPADQLAKTVETLAFAKDWAAMHAMWVLCVRLSPLVLAFAVYRVLKPRLIRLLESAAPTPSPSMASTSDSAGPLQPPAGQP